MTRYLWLLILLITTQSTAQDTLKRYEAVRTETEPRIDGFLDEPLWQQANVMTDFFQYLPLEGTKPDQPIEVRLLYDNTAIYVAARMFDQSRDSILRELGARDGEDINADYFRINFDPYNTRQDAYFFGVYASGVQFDNKVSDPTYDAVWMSAANIDEKGWTVEIKIPYSAIRFPKKKIQEWGFQVNRYTRRTREFTQWAKTPSSTANSQIYWGLLTGISNITAPVRLSFTPYLSGYLESLPVTSNEGKTTYSNSFSYNAGADVKYGIDERFTIDMTLFPDFGQVQSDNKVKNLSYREVTYVENRPFFKESVELFNKDDLFYSRRIGKIPSGYFSVESQLKPGETIDENPGKVKLLHALKLSGRTDNGTGIGVFNAITDNTYAVAKDSVGNKRDILTEPLTNFNVMVFDQQLKNNSNFYFINTNVARDKGYNDANVTGTGFTISNKKNTFAVEGVGAISQYLTKSTGEPTRNFNTELGYKYGIGVKKLGGLFEYGIGREVIDNNYFTSDLGYQVINSQVNYEAFIYHNVRNPWKIFRDSYNNLFYNYSTHFITNKPVSHQVSVNLFATLLDYNSIFAGGGFTPGTSYDYFEPRVEGRFSKSVDYYYSYAGVSTDYRKKVAIDFTLNISNFIGQFVSEGYTTDLSIRYRINDKLTLRAYSNYHFDPYNLGWVDVTPTDEVIYGLRILNTYENGINAKYIFKNDMFLSLNARHYWTTGDYRKYLTLLPDGEYEANYLYSINNNFNFNAFTIDLVYSWQFSPGSNLSIVYKNAIEHDETGVTQLPHFDKNFTSLVDDPQTNSISVKLIYYLDYLTLRKKTSGIKP